MPDPDELTLTRSDFEAARANVAPHVYHTPMLTSRSLSEATGFDVRLKAELFQRGGSYKVRGPMNKIAHLSPEERARGVICSSAGNHSQGVALAARQYGIPAVVVMAENATPSKIAATEGYGAQVVLHGSIWDEANEKALELVEERGLTYIHPFDDPQLIAGQGTVGLEIMEDAPDVQIIVVPIGGGGLISGISMAVKSVNPNVRVIGVESSGAPAMQRSVEAGHLVTLDHVDCVIDGLRVKRVGRLTRSVVSRFVDEIVTLPDEKIFDAVLWIMTRAKLVAEGAAAAPVAALLEGRVTAEPGTRVVAVLSGGNLDVEKLRGMSWN
jgi:threonine dehydratase